MATKRPKLDLNQLAKSIVDQAAGEVPIQAKRTPRQEAGRKGGLKGGKTRMENLTAAERSLLASLGVAARKKAPANATGAPAKT
jgi:hypothetical protein